MTKEDAVKGQGVRVIGGGLGYVGRGAIIVSNEPFFYDGVVCVKIKFDGDHIHWHWSIDKIELIERKKVKPLPLPG